MNRPDAMDLDVAVLLGLDAAAFVQPPPRAARSARVAWPAARPPKAKAKAKAKSADWTSIAQRSPWLWVIVPLTAALVVGVGMNLEPNEDKPPEQTAARAVAPEPGFRSVGTPRAMSLQIIDGPRSASASAPATSRQRPRNIPMSELGPTPGTAPPAAVEVAAAAPASEAGAARPDDAVPQIDVMSHFSDEELAPSLRAPAQLEPQSTSEPSTPADRVEAVDAVRALRQR